MQLLDIAPGAAVVVVPDFAGGDIHGGRELPAGKMTSSPSAVWSP